MSFPSVRERSVRTRAAVRHLLASYRRIATRPGVRRIRRLGFEVDQLLRDGDTAAARVAGERAVARHPGCRATMDLHIATTGYLGAADEALDMARRNASAHIAALSGGATAAPALRPWQRVFLSGYFYSGSGAVLDYLADHDGTVKWPPIGELRLVKGPGGLGDLAARHAATGRLTATDLVDHYLHLTGRAITLLPPGVYHPKRKVALNSRRLFADRAARGYLRACLSGFGALADADGESTSQVEQRMRDCVTAALDAAAADTGARTLLVDQAVTAWRLSLARLLPPSTFVVVHRDPRDNFAEARDVLSRPGRKATTAARFARSYRNRRVKADTAIETVFPDAGHRVLRIGFEDFVQRHSELAHQVRDFVGLDAAGYRRSRFDPETSRGNIGKHRTLITDDEAAILAEALPEFLHQPPSF